MSLCLGRGAARPAGVPEGGPGAKAGEGEGRGAAQGWHGDPRPHPQLCGKVSGGEWRRGGGGGGLSGSDSCQCLFCNRGVQPVCVGRGGDSACLCTRVYLCECVCVLCGFIYSISACCFTDPLVQ